MIVRKMVHKNSAMKKTQKRKKRNRKKINPWKKERKDTT